MPSLLKRLKLRSVAKAVHKDNLRAHRYSRVALVNRSNGQQVSTLVFHLDIPDKQFVMTHRGRLAWRHISAKQQYIEINDLRDLSDQGFNALYTNLRGWKKMKAKEIVPLGTPGVPH